MKKYILGLAVCAMMFGAFSFASAENSGGYSVEAQKTEIRAKIVKMNAQIAEMQAKVKEYEAKLVTLENGQTMTDAEKAAKTEFKRKLEVGSKGDDVRALQKILKAKGLLAVSDTGYYGNLTKEAVMNFQHKYGLTVTGKLDEATIAKFAEVNQ